jgi:hypothetical protein
MPATAEMGLAHPEPDLRGLSQPLMYLAPADPAREQA